MVGFLWCPQGKSRKQGLNKTSHLRGRVGQNCNLDPRVWLFTPLDPVFRITLFGRFREQVLATSSTAKRAEQEYVTFGLFYIGLTSPVRSREPTQAHGTLCPGFGSYDEWLALPWPGRPHSLSLPQLRVLLHSGFVLVFLYNRHSNGERRLSNKGYKEPLSLWFRAHQQQLRSIRGPQSIS